MFGLLLVLAQAAAAVVAPLQCEIMSEKAEEGALLFGVCGKSAVMFGPVSSYEAALNKETGAAVALIERDGEQRLLMVSPNGEASALLEDLTGDVARKAGRIADGGMAGLTVDMSGVAEAGVITVSALDKAGKRLAGIGGDLSVMKMIADEAIRQSLPKEKPNVVDVVSDTKPSEAR